LSMGFLAGQDVGVATPCSTHPPGGGA
jgi:hypothetical protein